MSYAQSHICYMRFCFHTLLPSILVASIKPGKQRTSLVQPGCNCQKHQQAACSVMCHGLMACMLVRQAAATRQLNLDFPMQIMHAPLIIQACCPIYCTSHTSAVQGTSELEALQQGQVDSSTMQFIDFEYGSYNYRGYDFANNWCEYAGFEGDYSRYPDERQQALFVTNYLQQQGNPSPVRPALCYNATRLTLAKADA